ncbi:MAG: nucleotide exchange factor GrpE [Anaerovoracaceae bacterium]
MGTNEHVSDSEREEPIKDSEELQDKAEDSGQTEAEMQTEAQNAGAEDSAGETAEDGGEKEDGDAKYLRLAADFQNFRRRVEKEKSDIYAYANEKIALDIIDVMDNFERALQHSEECADKQFVEGIGKIYKQLKSVLDKNNIVEIKAEGEDFDPNFHNAVTSEENSDFESGKVIQALQKGYTLNDKVIRPSMVRVAQ